MARPFAGDSEGSAAQAGGEYDDRSQHSGGHAISHVSAISLGPEERRGKK
jgi:hypothetical protein